MGGIFAWTDSAAESTSATLTDLCSKIEADIKDLDGKLKKLGGWDGLEHDAYQGKFTQWDQSTQKVGSVLKGVSLLMTKGNEAVKTFKTEAKRALESG